MQIPLVDLHAQYSSIRHEVLAAFDNVPLCNSFSVHGPRPSSKNLLPIAIAVMA